MSRCTICHASLLLIAPPPACTALASIFKLLCCSCCCYCAASSWLRCNSLVYVTSRTGACLVRQTFTAATTTTAQQHQNERAPKTGSLFALVMLAFLLFAALLSPLFTLDCNDSQRDAKRAQQLIAWKSIDGKLEMKGIILIRLRIISVGQKV